MKSITSIALLVIAGFCIFSCAKKSGNAGSTNNSNPQPAVTSFSVNGAAANSPVPGAYKSGHTYVLQATDNANYYPEIQITFADTTNPISGTYNVVRTATGPFQCTFMLMPNTALLQPRQYQVV